MPREGHDTREQSPTAWPSYFNPRAPRGARRAGEALGLPPEKLFQSTCPARGTTISSALWCASRLISIHVPREGHDDTTGNRRFWPVPVFQSTCPARGTTPVMGPLKYPIIYFNPRAPRGARLQILGHLALALVISIHVPREGHDFVAGDWCRFCPAFQSTCPARGTTANMHNFFVQICARVTNIPLKGMPYLQKTYVSI